MKTERLFVFDTNVLLSAFLFRTGIPRQALDLALACGSVMHSDETLDELWAVLVRPKFDRYLPLVDRLTLLRGFEQISIHHAVNTNVTLCRDPKDDKFLSLARSAQAECIISGDQDLRVLLDVFEIPILSPVDFLAHHSKP
jgi:uncharacterized protein